MEIYDGEEMIANLDTPGVAYTPPSIREYSGGHSTYSKDPDGNMIELMQRPLGRRDSRGNVVEVAHDPEGMVWTRNPGYGLATG